MGYTQTNKSHIKKAVRLMLNKINANLRVLFEFFFTFTDYLN